MLEKGDIYSIKAYIPNAESSLWILINFPIIQHYTDMSLNEL
jgi:hypothetical protein